MLQSLYRGLTHVAGPAVGAYLLYRRRIGKEDPERRWERLGYSSVARPPGRVVWFHAASVGESLSILSLIDRLAAAPPDVHVLVTTGTVTSARIMERSLPNRALHQYVPIDRPACVKRFLEHWQPQLAIWVESEIWPNLLWDLGRRRIPAILVNARMSDRSFHRWRRAPDFIRSLLGVFALCLCQSEADAERLRGLGAVDVRALGNLKYAAQPLPANPEDMASLQGVMADRPRWLMASSHPGEEEMAARVHRQLANQLPGLLTIIVPRHPSRGAGIAEMLGQVGLPVSLRSVGRLPELDDAVYLADTIGEMGLFLRAAPVVCIGGSLVPHGGHNPIEAAKLGRPVVYGPHMFNFSAIAEEMESAGAAWRVPDAEGLREAIGTLLTNQERCSRMVDAAGVVTNRNRLILERVMTCLDPYLHQAGIVLPG